MPGLVASRSLASKRWSRQPQPCCCIAIGETGQVNVTVHDDGQRVWRITWMLDAASHVALNIAGELRTETLEGLDLRLNWRLEGLLSECVEN